MPINLQDPAQAPFFFAIILAIGIFLFYWIRLLTRALMPEEQPSEQRRSPADRLFRLWGLIWHA